MAGANSTRIFPAKELSSKEDIFIIDTFGAVGDSKTSTSTGPSKFIITKNKHFWISGYAVFFAWAAFFSSFFGVIINLHATEPGQSSATITALGALGNGKVSYIPVIATLILQLYQAVSVTVYFVSTQMGVLDKFLRHVGVFLIFPIFCAMLLFRLFPAYFLETPILCIQIFMIMLYHVWILTAAYMQVHPN